MVRGGEVERRRACEASRVRIGTVAEKVLGAGVMAACTGEEQRG